MKNYKKLLLSFTLSFLFSFACFIYLDYEKGLNYLESAHYSETILSSGNKSTSIGFSEFVIVEWIAQSLSYLITLKQ